jgi:hypothetical protein
VRIRACSRELRGEPRLRREREGFGAIGDRGVEIAQPIVGLRAAQQQFRGRSV